jgi:hypothetical protein
MFVGHLAIGLIAKRIESKVSLGTWVLAASLADLIAFPDKLFIERILADDWSVTDLTGRVLSKTEVLEEVFGSEDRRVVSMRIDDLSVRSFGDWAIVTGRTRAAGEYRGEVVEVSLRFTDVFARRNRTWQVVASQATLISE